MNRRRHPRHGQLFMREATNPILSPEDWPYTVNAVFNPGVTIGPDGETILLVRVEDRSGVSHLTVARSSDGLTGWVVEEEPFILPTRGRYEDRWGAEDPRITRVGEEYYISYTGFSPSGPLVILARTLDFRSYEFCSIVAPPEDKDAALFPRLIGVRHALFHRPVASGAHGEAPNMWLSFSPDLVHWGDHRIVIEPRRSGNWDREKVGLGPPPLETPSGWLVLFHGVKATAAGSLYRVGVALLDLDQPSVVLARGDEWVFGPEAPYELQGDVPGVVFPTGWVVQPDGRARVYYGAADSTVAVAFARVDELIEFAFSHCVCATFHPGQRCPMGGADPARAAEERPDPLAFRPTSGPGLSASAWQDPDRT
jgi:predicted GH43/DUF377 family glycosyl hydrolase